MTPATSQRGEGGFTLVELPVAMVLSLAVLLATLGAFDVFGSETAQQTRNVSANDTVRRTMDRTVAELRTASTVLRAEPLDLVYAVPEPTGVRTERLCVTADGLWASSVTAPAAQMPAAACQDGTRIANVRAGVTSAFSYDGATTAAAPAAVRNVGLAFALDSSGGTRTGRSTLAASAAVRRTTTTLTLNQGSVPIACSQAGPLVQLGAGVGAGASDGPLTVSYTTNANVVIPGGTLSPNAPSSPVTLPPGATGVTATIKNAFGVVVGTLQKLVPCVA